MLNFCTLGLNSASDILAMAAAAAEATAMALLFSTRSMFSSSMNVFDAVEVMRVMQALDANLDDAAIGGYLELMAILDSFMLALLCVLRLVVDMVVDDWYILEVTDDRVVVLSVLFPWSDSFVVPPAVANGFDWLASIFERL